MNTTIRSLLSIGFLTIVALSARAEQTVPPVKFTIAQAPAASPASAPINTTTPQAPGAAAIAVPKMLEGQVTEPEWRRYMEFQSRIRENPEIKALNDEVMTLSRQMQTLQGKLNVLRANAIGSDPEMRKLDERIKASLAKAHAAAVRPN